MKRDRMDFVDALDNLRPATKREIREYYKARGYKAVICMDGEVICRNAASWRNVVWQMVAYVENYKVDGNGNVHCI